MDLNLVVLSGTLAVTPELHRFDSGKRRLDYLVTVRTMTDGRIRTHTINVKYWDPPARLARKKLIRGDRVWIAGTVQRRFWSSFDGKRSRLEIVASQVVYRASDLSLEAFDPDQNVAQSDDLAATTT
jgi:single-stranded DNA-binding protein